MPKIKSPGGYQIIDLNGAILETEVSIPYEPWEYAAKCKKPVYITNFSEPSYYYMGPILLQSQADTETDLADYFVAVNFDSTHGSPELSITVTLDHENKTAKIKASDLSQ